MAVAVVMMMSGAGAGGFLLYPPPEMKKILDRAREHEGAGGVVAVDLTSLV